MSTMFPAFRRRDTLRYTAILTLILVTIGFQLAASDSDWARFVTVVLQGGTLLLALQVGRIHGLLDRALIALVIVAVAVSAVAATGLGTIGDFDARVINLLLLLFSPIAISLGMVADMRARHRVTVRTILGVLSIYLLFGLIFTFIFGIVASESSMSFFKNGPSTTADLLYFSYATLTTVGYGDLVAQLHTARSFAIIEALIGQIYLVSVVALIVGNLGRLPSGAPGGSSRSSRQNR
jgi:hypothetical protein